MVTSETYERVIPVYLQSVPASWIALFLLAAIMLNPVDTSINPILHNIDSRNPEGPHFRQFLVMLFKRNHFNPWLFLKLPKPISSPKALQVESRVRSSLIAEERAVPDVSGTPSTFSSPFQRSQKLDVGLDNIGNLQLIENSLENFKVELHPEEELERRG